MSTFKDIIKDDLSIFFNEDELADLHTISDGRGRRKLNIIVDNDALMKRSEKEFDGVSIREILYFVKASEFGELPSIDTPQKFDGRPMFVKSAIENDGMYEIVLSQNRG